MTLPAPMDAPPMMKFTIHCFVSERFSTGIKCAGTQNGTPTDNKGRLKLTAHESTDGRTGFVYRKGGTIH